MEPQYMDYQLPKKLDFKNLRICLDNYTPAFLFIRLMGSIAATEKIDAFKVGERLENRTLNFKKNKRGLYMLIDNVQTFHFPLKDYVGGFKLTYERFDNGGLRVWDDDDPYNPALPEPRKSTLKTILDDHLLEIDFDGRIHLKFHSWKKDRPSDHPIYKDWTIALEKPD